MVAAVGWDETGALLNGEVGTDVRAVQRSTFDAVTDSVTSASVLRLATGAIRVSTEWSTGLYGRSTVFPVAVHRQRVRGRRIRV